MESGRTPRVLFVRAPERDQRTSRSRRPRPDLLVSEPEIQRRKETSSTAGRVHDLRRVVQGRRDLQNPGIRFGREQGSRLLKKRSRTNKETSLNFLEKSSQKPIPAFNNFL